ncbi:MAG: hypothetical protein K2Q04_09850 [Hyphomicrobium sp.]|nr:hypothetical protein [Hyphomicrobium sp.]
MSFQAGRFYEVIENGAVLEQSGLRIKLRPGARFLCTDVDEDGTPPFAGGRIGASRVRLLRSQLALVSPSSAINVTDQERPVYEDPEDR